MRGRFLWRFSPPLPATPRALLPRLFFLAVNACFLLLTALSDPVELR